MSLLQVKKDFEQYFMDNYNETQVHWAGMNWDINKYDEWVYFEYVGQSVDDLGLDNTIYNHSGYLDITIVAKTRFRVMDIADIIIGTFKGKKIADSFTSGVRIVSTGTIKDIDKSYTDINIEIKMV